MPAAVTEDMEEDGEVQNLLPIPLDIAKAPCYLYAMKSATTTKDQAMKIRRPLIDINPDAPLKFHGFRIAHDGSVFATTTRMTHGRTNKNYEVAIGTVIRNGRNWIATALDGTQHTDTKQDEAGKWLEHYTEENQG